MFEFSDDLCVKVRVESMELRLAVHVTMSAYYCCRTTSRIRIRKGKQTQTLDVSYQSVTASCVDEGPLSPNRVRRGGDIRFI